MPLAVAANDNVAGPQLIWVHANHMGVPAVYTDSSGAAINAPSGYSAPGFPGQSRTLGDLYYNRYRDYDPSTGRYIQADPIGLDGGASPYSYAMNSPLRYSDPTGEIVPLAIPLAIGAGAGIGLGLAYIYEWNNHSPLSQGYRAGICLMGGSHDNSGGSRSGSSSIPVVVNNKGEGDRCVDGWLYETEVYCPKNFKGDAYFRCLKRAGDRLRACKREGQWPPSGPRRWSILEERDYMRSLR